MKKSIKILGIATLFAIGTIIMSGCGSQEQKTEEHQHMEGHDHEAMETEMSDIHIMQCPQWENGEHQHATYVCTMWCEAGESEEVGKCKSCGMQLVRFADVKAKHDMQQHAGGHGEHDGHDH